MLTRLLENIDPLPDDLVIVGSLAIDPQSAPRAGEICPMGIRNADGMVYRVVQAQGV
jgi:hypothetical protein